jgi:hypothetical protein
VIRLGISAIPRSPRINNEFGYPVIYRLWHGGPLSLNLVLLRLGLRS